MVETNFYNQKSVYYKLNLRDITCSVLAITIFLSIDPFFVWSSFGNGIGLTIFKVFQILAMILLIIQIKFEKMSLPVFLCGTSMLGIFFFYCFFTGVETGTTHPLLIGNILIYMFYALNVMTDRDILLKSFSQLQKIFVVILFYTLIIYILLLLNIKIPYTILESGEAGRVKYGNQYYQNYFGCLLINQSGELLYRFTSVFTEPGVVGTFCAFFLSANDFNVSNSKRNKIFLVSGILSLSVAFFVLTIFAYILKLLRKGGYKNIVGIVFIIILYFVFINVNFSNTIISSFQERLTITKSGLEGDNRIHEIAEASYQSFLKSDLETVLFGYGFPSLASERVAWQATASYKESIYHLGVLGYGLMIVWFVLSPILCYKSNCKTKNSLMYSYIAIFILSQYQRPYMKTLFLVYILLAGCLYSQKSTERDNQC